MLRIFMYRDSIEAFLNYKDGCVMRQQVDVPTIKLTPECITLPDLIEAVSWLAPFRLGGRKGV